MWRMFGSQKYKCHTNDELTVACSVVYENKKHRVFGIH